MLETNGLKVTGAIVNGYNVKSNHYGYGAMAYQYEYKSRKSA